MSIAKTLQLKYVPLILAAMLTSLAGVYWFAVAAERYVADAKVIIQTPSNGSHFSLRGMISGGNLNNKSDLLYLMDYLTGQDVFGQLDDKFKLTQHFQSDKVDFVARLKSGSKIDAHERYQELVTVTLDDYSGVLSVKVSLYESGLSADVAKELLKIGEAYLNKINLEMVFEQVEIITQQTNEMKDALIQSRKNLLLFQNQHNLLSAEGEIATLQGLISELEGQVAAKEVEFNVVGKSMTKRSYSYSKTEKELTALKEQLAQARARLSGVSHGQSFTSVLSKYEELKLQAEFDLEMYASAMRTLELTRAESAKQLKKVVVLQSPNSSDIASEPERLKGFLTSLFFILVGLVFFRFIGKVVKNR